MLGRSVNTKTTGAVAQYARLRVRQQRARWWSALLFLRLALLTVAVAVVVVGGVRYVSRAERAGALEFTPHDIGLSGSAVGVQAVEIHDIDGDGDQDIITTGLEGVKIYQNKGDLAFTITLVDTLPAERVQAVDLNADGRADLLVTYKGGQPSVQWYENLGELKFRPHSLSGAGVNVVAYAGDINADGSPDVVTAGRTSEGIVLKRWMNNGSGKLASSLLASASGVTAISIGDLDQDGYNDVVVGGNQGLIRWDTSDGTVWDQIVIDASQTDQTHIAVASSSVSRSYVAAAHGLNDEVYLYLSGPDAASYANYGRVLVASGIDAKTVVVTDVEGDGDIDVLVAAQDDQAVFWFENDGGTGFTEHRLISDVLNVYGVAAADVTGDLVVDVVTADHVRGTVILLEQVASLTDEDALGLVLPASDETQAEAEPQRNPADRAEPQLSRSANTATAVRNPTDRAEPAEADKVAPVAEAGIDQVVARGATVILDGSESLDPDAVEGNYLRFSWRQIDGPVVELSQTDSAVATFTAGGAGEVYIFILSVRDESGAVTTDTVTVTTTSGEGAGLVAGDHVAVTGGGLTGWRGRLSITAVVLLVLAGLVTVVGFIGLVTFAGAGQLTRLKVWQVVQQFSAVSAWPLYAVGLLFSIGLALHSWQLRYLLLIGLFVVLIIARWRGSGSARETHGIVRNAVTQLPLSNVIIRWYDQATDVLVGASASGSSGRFFALPKSGRYRLVISKSGFAPFIKKDVAITADQDVTISVVVDLMPTAPGRL